MSPSNIVRDCLTSMACTARNILVVLIPSIAIASCAFPPESELYQQSPDIPPYKQDSFDEYVAQTRDWVAKHRVFITDDRETELARNIPFELGRTTPDGKAPTRGVLFVHGLGASPWYFHDIANEMAQNGWLARSMLLPGHGTRPADLSIPSYTDWTAAVAHQVALLEREVDEVWLGGFSTGGNLVTSYAAEHSEISGLLLFSPGIYPDNGLLFLTPVIKYLWDWIDVDPEDNAINYQSLSSKASELYYRTVKDVQDHLDAKPFDRPVVLTMSADDSVLAPVETLRAFEDRFTNPKSRFVWYDDAKAPSNDDRVATLNSNLPEQQISTFSHLSVLFSPDNPYYGVKGSFVFVENGQEDIALPDDLSTIWRSSWGYTEPGKYHGRLTWNPYFDTLIDTIGEVTN
ncbi:alpha/beta fold hydrolase [Thalassospira sp. HF15]|uniref:alpha/beta hydrolase n=1 Tax=Thalassospira sp. HF15 TaxID=2722755 RepID=UPI0014307CD5|nr:alpha/beta fold hydrolase [Thalassospira sp. HF15]NIY76281.1 alpha/beta fold hydrolase [Thalassospira sp. HF15]